MIDKDSFKEAYLHKVQIMYDKSPAEANRNERYAALGSLIRDYINPNWTKSSEQYRNKGEKQLFYFSIEFLLGNFWK